MEYTTAYILCIPKTINCLFGYKTRMNTLLLEKRKKLHHRLCCRLTTSEIVAKNGISIFMEIIRDLKCFFVITKLLYYAYDFHIRPVHTLLKTICNIISFLLFSTTIARILHSHSAFISSQ